MRVMFLCRRTKLKAKAESVLMRTHTSDSKEKVTYA